MDATLIKMETLAENLVFTHFKRHQTPNEIFLSIKNITLSIASRFDLYYEIETFTSGCLQYYITFYGEIDSTIVEYLTLINSNLDIVFRPDMSNKDVMRYRMRGDTHSIDKHRPVFVFFSFQTLQ